MGSDPSPNRGQCQWSPIHPMFAASRINANSESMTSIPSMSAIFSRNFPQSPRLRLFRWTVDCRCPERSKGKPGSFEHHGEIVFRCLPPKFELLRSSCLSESCQSLSKFRLFALQGDRLGVSTSERSRVILSKKQDSTMFFAGISRRPPV